MEAEESSKCPRCKQSSNKLTSSQALKNKYQNESTSFWDSLRYKSLCIECEREIKDSLQYLKSEKLNSANPDKLIKDIHYTLDGDLMVFTTLYHLQRGFCCGSGCKKCPWGR